MSLLLPVLTFDQWVESQSAEVQSANSSLIDLSPGSPLLAQLQANAYVGLYLQYLNALTIQAMRLATASGNDVDSFGTDFGFTRLAGSYSSGDVTFSRYDSTNISIIPVGTLVKSADGTLTFTVVADTNQAAYSAALSGYQAAVGATTLDVTVQCSTLGTAGNVVAGTISTIASNTGDWTSCTNANAFTSGTDAETDAAYRTRFVLFINSRYGGTTTALEDAITSVQQGLTYTIQENVLPNGSTQNGSITVTIDDGSGNPSGTLITALQTAITAPSVHVPGTIVYVQGPTIVEASIVLTLTVLSGYVFSTVQAAIVASITSYVNSLSVGATLPYSILGKLAWDSASGIANITALALNGGTDDLTTSETQVIKTSSVVVG